MSQWYEVTLRAYQTILVEMEDEDDEDAIYDAAVDASDFTFVSEKEIVECVPISEERVENAKLCADAVNPLPKEES